MESGERTRADHQEMEEGGRTCGPAGGVSRGTARRCRECEGRETLLAKLNSVDWTADELHLNGGCNTPMHSASLTCTCTFCRRLTAAAAPDARDVMCQRSLARRGGMIRAIASHDTAGLSCRFGEYAVCTCALQKPQAELLGAPRPRVSCTGALSFLVKHKRT